MSDDKKCDGCLRVGCLITIEKSNPYDYSHHYNCEYTHEPKPFKGPHVWLHAGNEQSIYFILCIECGKMQGKFPLPRQ